MAPLSVVLNRTSRPVGWTVLAGCLAALAAGALAPLTTTAQQSTNPATNQGRKISLHDQLTTGLYAVTKSDRAFIDKVVLLVEEGKLPPSLVDGTFFWARARAAHRSPTRRLRPMVYFQPALAARARRIGVNL
jgi:hypothetical protein